MKKQTHFTREQLETLIATLDAIKFLEDEMSANRDWAKGYNSGVSASQKLLRDMLDARAHPW